jgi:hypothetical protein
MELPDIQQNGHDRSSVLVILFSELDQENKVQDGVHIQTVGNKTSSGGTLEISDEEKPTRFYAPAGEEWWKTFTCGQDGSAYVQTSKGAIKKGLF